VTGSGQRRGRRPADRSALLVEAPHLGADCWPALDVEASSVLLVRPVPGHEGRREAIWSVDAGSSRARPVFDWMADRADQWPLWARLACLFGEPAVTAIVVQGAERDAEQVAVAEENARLEAEERRRLHERVELFVLDPKNKRPGLSLESGDEHKPFFVMRFSEKWERERVLDWMRWQKPRFLQFRALVEAEGSVALERAVIAGMRETEAELKRRGLSSGGRRPLRFWRGE
jgi:hypothetical protein